MVVERIHICELDGSTDPNDQNVVRYRFACEFVENLRVLDVACGTGYGTKMLSSQGHARHVLGLDVSCEAIDTMHAHAVAGQVEFALAKAEQLPILSEGFDTVISMETVEHLPDPMIFLKELRRGLRREGIAIISTPLNNSESRFHPQNPYHLREYSAPEFKSLINTTFSECELWSQITNFRDDLEVGPLKRFNGASSFRAALRAVTPAGLRQTVRRAVRSQGLQPVHSRIVRGIDDSAHVQIAVCRV